jgi:hypothetical protein
VVVVDVVEGSHSTLPKSMTSRRSSESFAAITLTRAGFSRSSAAGGALAGRT